MTYEKIGTIQRRLAWPLHKDDTLSRSGRSTDLNIYFIFLIVDLSIHFATAILVGVMYNSLTFFRYLNIHQSKKAIEEKRTG